MRTLTDADKDELETVHQQLLAVATEIARRINRGTITPVGKREIVSPLLGCARRVARIGDGGNVKLTARCHTEEDAIRFDDQLDIYQEEDDE